MTVKFLCGMIEGAPQEGVPMPWLTASEPRLLRERQTAVCCMLHLYYQEERQRNGEKGRRQGEEEREICVDGRAGAKGGGESCVCVLAPS